MVSRSAASSAERSSSSEIDPAAQFAIAASNSSERGMLPIGSVGMDTFRTSENVGQIATPPASGVFGKRESAAILAELSSLDGQLIASSRDTGNNRKSGVGRVASFCSRFHLFHLHFRLGYCRPRLIRHIHAQCGALFGVETISLQKS